MPPEKKIKKPVEFIRNPWNTGDVYAYMFHTDIAAERGFQGKYIVFKKIGDMLWYDNLTFSVVQVYNKIFSSLPDLNDICNVPLLPLITANVMNLKLTESEEEYKRYFNRFFKAIMIYLQKRSYPKKYFTFIGNALTEEIKHDYKVIEYDYTQCTELDWHMNNMDEWLSSFYLEWSEIDYSKDVY